MTRLHAIPTRRQRIQWRSIVFAALVITGTLSFFESIAAASPFGAGIFGADVPFGSATSISISTNGNVAIIATPSGGTFNGQGSHIITVTSTDVVGYELYTKSPSGTDMTNGTDTIPTSSNTTPSSLAMNTWGYNTDNTADYVGIKTTDTLIKDMNGPYKNGDDTSVTYGVRANSAKSAGAYTVGITYTAVAKSG